MRLSEYGKKRIGLTVRGSGELRTLPRVFDLRKHGISSLDRPGLSLREKKSNFNARVARTDPIPKFTATKQRAVAVDVNVPTLGQDAGGCCLEIRLEAFALRTERRGDATEWLNCEK
ncbi:hypothetical protein KM043_008374 [Ampulex compressa]|nr:hypothetical protein KM043_008374 [Ampulex compressa]